MVENHIMGQLFLSASHLWTLFSSISFFSSSFPALRYWSSSSLRKFSIFHVFCIFVSPLNHTFFLLFYFFTFFFFKLLGLSSCWQWIGKAWSLIQQVSGEVGRILENLPYIQFFQRNHVLHNLVPQFSILCTKLGSFYLFYHRIHFSFNHPLSLQNTHTHAGIHAHIHTSLLLNPSPKPNPDLCSKNFWNDWGYWSGVVV